MTESETRLFTILNNKTREARKQKRQQEINTAITVLDKLHFTESAIKRAEEGLGFIELDMNAFENKEAQTAMKYLRANGLEVEGVSHKEKCILVSWENAIS